MIPIKLWWCCLNPRERNAIMAILPSFLTMGSYIRKDVFEFYWLALGYSYSNAMVQWFITIYGLIPGTVDDGEGGTIDVLFLETVFWSNMYAFSLTDDFICLTECRVLAYSNL